MDGKIDVIEAVVGCGSVERFGFEGVKNLLKKDLPFFVQQPCVELQIHAIYYRKPSFQRMEKIRCLSLKN